jgi:hypothetical protein
MKPSLESGNALTTLMMAAGEMVPQPSWGPLWTPALLARPDDGFLSEADYSMIAVLTDTLIPFSGKAGALSAGVDKYLAAYITDCLTTQQQLAIREGLAGLDQIARRSFGRGFVACGKGQREQILLMLKNSSDEDQRMFFRFMQTRTVQGFISSEQVMEQHTA